MREKTDRKSEGGKVDMEEVIWGRGGTASIKRLNVVAGKAKGRQNPKSTANNITGNDSFTPLPLRE